MTGVAPAAQVRVEPGRDYHLFVLNDNRLQDESPVTGIPTWVLVLCLQGTGQETALPTLPDLVKIFLFPRRINRRTGFWRMSSLLRVGFKMEHLQEHLQHSGSLK